MTRHAVKPHKSRGKSSSLKKAHKSTPAKEKVAASPVAETKDQPGTRIVVLTGDPRRNVVIMPGCHFDSLRGEANTYFFEDGNELVGMIVEGGTVEYDAGDRTYTVRLTDGRYDG